MLALILFVGLQSADAAKVLGDFKSLDVQMDRVFDCMDAGSKAQLKAQVESATPESVVDAAITDCKPQRDDLRSAMYRSLVLSSDADSATKKADSIAADFMKNLRTGYVEQVDKWLIDPKLAEMRSNLVARGWSACVRDKAVAWAKLKDDAKTVAEAAVSACAAKRENVERATGYSLRSKNLSAIRARELMTAFDEKIATKAVEWVIEERAKALPK